MLPQSPPEKEDHSSEDYNNQNGYYYVQSLNGHCLCCNKIKNKIPASSYSFFDKQKHNVISIAKHRWFSMVERTSISGSVNNFQIFSKLIGRTLEVDMYRLRLYKSLLNICNVSQINM